MASNVLYYLHYYALGQRRYERPEERGLLLPDVRRNPSSLLLKSQSCFFIHTPRDSLRKRCRISLFPRNTRCLSAAIPHILSTSTNIAQSQSSQMLTQETERSSGNVPKICLRGIMQRKKRSVFIWQLGLILIVVSFSSRGEWFWSRGKPSERYCRSLLRRSTVLTQVSPSLIVAVNTISHFISRY